jgi:hypothetical protein
MTCIKTHLCDVVCIEITVILHKSTTTTLQATNNYKQVTVLVPTSRLKL